MPHICIDLYYNGYMIALHLRYDTRPGQTKGHEISKGGSSAWDEKNMYKELHGFD